MKRTFDFCSSLLALAVLNVPLLLVALLVRLTSDGPILYWSDRVGRDNRIFKMPKFRTMRTDTPAVATHLFRSGKKIKGLRGGVPLYAAQGILHSYDARAKKNPFRMETK